jgi:hypothetical protein
VRPQSFDIVDFEVGPLHAELDVADAIEFAIREDVAIDEGCAHRLVPALLVMRDAVIQEQSAWTQNAPNGRQVSRQVGQAHVLEHADARHLVVNAFAGEIPVVAQLHCHFILQSFGPDALLRVLELRAA